MTSGGSEGVGRGDDDDMMVLETCVGGNEAEGDGENYVDCVMLVEMIVGLMVMMM